MATRGGSGLSSGGGGVSKPGGISKLGSVSKSVGGRAAAVSSRDGTRKGVSKVGDRRSKSLEASRTRSGSSAASSKPGTPTSSPPRTDALLASGEPQTSQIVRGARRYDFRRYRLADSAARVWLYRTAPLSRVEYVCEIGPARTRAPGSRPLPEPEAKTSSGTGSKVRSAGNGKGEGEGEQEEKGKEEEEEEEEEEAEDHGFVGNREFNGRHPDWEGYDFAYQILSVRRLDPPVTLSRLRERYGLRTAPRGLVYVPAKMLDEVSWERAEKLWEVQEDAS